MANTFKSIQATVNSAAANVYTVPAGTVAVVIGMRIGNNLTDSDIWATARLVRGATKTNVLGEQTPIPNGSAIEGVMGSKMVMQAADALELQGSADGCAELTLSVMEIS
jgi:hypothetical protein